MKFSRGIKAKIRRRMMGPTIRRNPGVPNTRRNRDALTIRWNLDVPTTRRNPDVPTIGRHPDVPTTRINLDWLELGVQASPSSIAGNLTRLDSLADHVTPAEGGELNEKTPTIYVLPSHEAIIQNKYDCYWNAATDV